MIIEIIDVYLGPVDLLKYLLHLKKRGLLSLFYIYLRKLNITTTKMNLINNINIITCSDHSGNLVTHICQSENCYKPLCSKCIKDHNMVHKRENTFPEIDTIEDIKSNCQAKINETL